MNPRDFFFNFLDENTSQKHFGWRVFGHRTGTLGGVQWWMGMIFVLSSSGLAERGSPVGPRFFA